MQKASQHLFVSLVLFVMAFFMPSCVADSFLVERGVRGALVWLEPEGQTTDTPPQTIGEKLRGVVGKAGQVMHEGTYGVTKALVGAIAKFAVWLLFFASLILWSLLEFRKALAVFWTLVWNRFAKFPGEGIPIG